MKVKIANQLLIRGDCFEILSKKKKQSIDCIITDPPYNFDNIDFTWKSEKVTDTIVHSGMVNHIPPNTRLGGNKNEKWYKSNYKLNIDFANTIHKLGLLCKPILKHGAFFGLFCASKSVGLVQYPLIKSGYFPKDIIIWKRNSGAPRALPEHRLGIQYEYPLTNDLHSKHEMFVIMQQPFYGTYRQAFEDNQLSVFARYINLNEVSSNFIEYNKKKEDTNINHPTNKPLGLMKILVNLLVIKNKRVLDPFAGSGTTLIACHILNRKGIGIERDKNYFDLAVSRLEEYCNEKAR